MHITGFVTISVLFTVLLTGCGESSAPVAHAAPEPAKPEVGPKPAPKPAVTPAISTAGILAPARIVAVGDLHADLNNAVATLQLAGILDAEQKWSGGDTVFVQTGDLTDRGPDSKELIDLMRRLGPEAQAAGGQVVSLLGNHETMNMLGDLRYVTPEDFAHFGGRAARKEAFALDGAYGAWLLQQNAVAKVNDTVFVHGGVHPRWADTGIDGTNEAVRSALQGGPPDVLGTDGPLWLRAYVQLPEADACGPLQQALTTMGATRMVVGHTTRRDGKIQTRCSGRLHVIDIGIADHYGGNLGAWELIEGDARALYPTGPVDLEDPPK